MNQLILTFIVDTRRRFQMKILKTALLLLLPAIALVACSKSQLKPADPASTTETSTTVNNSANTNMSARPANQVSTSGTNPVSIVGSGDADRDGGEKKLKK